jgi:hypothetical protein
MEHPIRSPRGRCTRRACGREPSATVSEKKHPVGAEIFGLIGAFPGILLERFRYAAG